MSVYWHATHQLPGARNLQGRHTRIYKIASGGMADIWACLDRDTGDLVAIKRLNSNAMDELRQGLGGHLEEHALRSLSHPNVLRLLEYGFDGETLCFVTELIPGINFDHYLSRRPLRLETFGHLAGQILSATAAIHNAGLLHGDLKPENMMLVQEASRCLEIKILDFGTAEVLDPLGFIQHSRPGSAGVLATVEYVAPEILLGQPTGIASDLYSLGMTFYHALAGRPAFDASDVRDVIRAQINEQPYPLLERCPGLTPEVEGWVFQLLAKDPQERPGSAGEAFELLQQALQGQEPSLIPQ